ncbi:hypothetical protein BDZ89DRAFT_479775 [Hymenopellis radicata]|nr:hypothetical protein BDZ89DRAFT_479775 [Hymenopellis radicata]
MSVRRAGRRAQGSGLGWNGVWWAGGRRLSLLSVGRLAVTKASWCCSFPWNCWSCSDLGSGCDAGILRCGARCWRLCCCGCWFWSRRSRTRRTESASKWW